MRRPRVTEFLVKITKYCNLRCRYCNEYRELHNDERMDLEDIRRIFQRIAHYHDADDSEPIIFIWHGGEPFLVPLEIYEAIGQIQKEIFRGKREILNGVQTNLTILTDRHIDILKSGKFFAGLGVSVDPYGNQRVDMRGKLRTNLVFDNIQKLIDHGIEFAVITVLARNTLPYARNSYEFFDRLGIESKFVPFYLESFEQQILEHGLTGAEIAEAMVTIFDTWSASETAA